MNIVVFDIILTLLAAMTSRRREIPGQMELIDDYKKWNADEVRYRIAGARRRDLNPRPPRRYSRNGHSLRTHDNEMLYPPELHARGR